MGTQLHRDVRKKGRYLTLDFWVSEAAYETFRQHYVAEYRALDKQCEPLTEQEILLGSFLCKGGLKV